MARVDAHEKIIRTLSARGIVCSVCSKNDMEAATKILRSRGMEAYFIFPSIDWSAKGRRIKEIIDNAQLRAETVLFVDGNHLNRAEALVANPGLNVASESIIPEMLAHPQLVGKDDSGLSRLAQFQSLQLRKPAASEPKLVGD